MQTESNPWTDDYTCPGEAALRGYCEEEPQPESFEPAEVAWFASGVRSGVSL